MSEQQQQGVVVGCLFKALPTQSHQQKPVEAACIWKLPNQTVQKLLSASEKLAWVLWSPSHAGVGCGATEHNSGPCFTARRAGPGHFQKHKSALGCLLSTSNFWATLSSISSWTLSLLFHFSFWKEEFLRLLLILFLSLEAAKKSVPIHIRQQFYFLGVSPEKHPVPSAASGRLWNASRTWGCWAVSLPWAMARGPWMSSRLHIHQSSPRASTEPSWAFIYNLLTTEWKLIEAAGSKCLPVCQQQMALLPGQEPFNSSWLRDSQGILHHVSGNVIFTKMLFHCLWLSCFQFQAVRMAQDLLSLIFTLPTFICTAQKLLLQPPAVPGVNAEHAWTISPLFISQSLWSWIHSKPLSRSLRFAESSEPFQNPQKLFVSPNSPLGCTTLEPAQLPKPRSIL